MHLPGETLNQRLFSALREKEEAAAPRTNSKSGFVVRLELHNVRSYDRIHEELAKEGIVVYVYDQKGTSYKLLPTTLYCANPEAAPLTNRQVHAKVVKAINAALDNEEQKAMTQPPGILIIKTEELMWSGLDKAV